MLPDGPLCVIEPHADDAFLSLGWSIRAWVKQGRPVEIVTVYSADERRAAEAEAYAGSVGASWSGLGHAGFSGEWRPDYPAGPLPERLLPDRLLDPSITRIWPLGLQNSEHAAVAGAAAPGEPRYVDTPYQLDPYYQQQLRGVVVGKTIVWWHRAPLKKWEASAIFESQAMLFERYTPEILQGVPEIVVV